MAKVGVITENEKTGKETQNVYSILVQGKDFDRAYKSFVSVMEGALNWKLLSFSETKIVDVILQEKEDKDGL